MTEYPPGPNLAALAAIGRQKIYVTSPHYDNIGKVLSSLGVEFEPFAGHYDCDLLFINCGTGDRIDVQAVRALVEGGGGVYSSDLAASVVEAAFPEKLKFGGPGGCVSGSAKAHVIDAELAGVLGPSIDVTFDAAACRRLTVCHGSTLLAASGGILPSGYPIMVEVEHGQGAVFYTSFHNQAQNSEAEQALLQLLVLKQLGAKGHKTIAQVSRSLGVSLDRIGAKAR